MSKIVTIPYGMNPFVVIFNGDEYVYEPGTTVRVPDGVAIEIEEYIQNQNKNPSATQPPFNTDGKDGVGIASVMQSHKSTEDEGDNIIVVTLTNGARYTFTVRNGSRGSSGEQGPPGEKGERGDVSLEQLDKAINDSEQDIQKELEKVKKQIEDILYVPIVVNSFTNSVNTAEIGSTVRAVSLSWAFNKEPVSATLDGEEIEPAQMGSHSGNAYEIKADKTFTLSATDERGAVATKTTAISFYNRIRYGAAADYSELALSDGVLSGTKGRTFTATAGEGQYIWYMLPKRLGTCAFKVGGFDGGFTLFKAEQLTNASGYTEEYYIYRSDNAALGETTVTVA